MHVLSKHEILTLISQDVNYIGIAKAVAKNNLLYKDLFQDGLIVLLETDEAKIIRIYEKKELKYYFYGILNRINIDRLRAEFKHIDIAELDLPERIEQDENIPNEIKNIIDKDINDLVDEDYGKALLKLSIDLGSGAEVARKTGIHVRTVNLSIEKTKEVLRKKYGN